MKHTLTIITALLLAPLVCLSSAQAQQTQKPTNADEAKAIAAAIKFHESVDTVIAGNLIRRVDHQSHGAFGIWMDWGNQGTRITGNIIYDTKAAAVFLEMDHGPILVDNNVLVGQGVRSNSEGSVFAHNLFVDCTFEMDLRREETPLGVTFIFAVGKAPLGLRGPRVDAALVGVMPTVGQTIEDRYGKAISVDTDIRGLNRQDRIPGPLAGLKPERNTIAWSLEPAARPDEGKPAP